MSDLSNNTVEYQEHVNTEARTVVRLADITKERGHVVTGGERDLDLAAREAALTARQLNDAAVTAAKDAVEVN